MTESHQFRSWLIYFTPNCTVPYLLSKLYKLNPIYIRLQYQLVPTRQHDMRMNFMLDFKLACMEGFEKPGTGSLCVFCVCFRAAIVDVCNKYHSYKQRRSIYTVHKSQIFISFCLNSSQLYYKQKLSLLDDAEIRTVQNQRSVIIHLE